ncbi:MAG: transaldolase family protein [Pseudomonadota bacterium]
MTIAKSLLHQMTLEYPTEFWNDGCEVNSLRNAIEHGATGATSNPVIVLEAIKTDEPRWFDTIVKLCKTHPTEGEHQIAWRLVAQAACDGADLLRPVFDKSQGKHGRLCVQVNPRFYRNSNDMISHALELSALRPNMAIKIPAVAAGIAAIEELTAQGVVINATVLFTLSQALTVAQAIERGLEKAQIRGIDISAVTPWVTIMVGRLDDHLRDIVKERDIKIDPENIRQASTAVMRKAYRLFQKRGYKTTLLSAAMRSYHHWSEFVGGNLVITIPPAWQNKFNNSGITLRSRIDDFVDDRVIDELSNKLPDFVCAYEEKGLSSEQFVSFGASRKTLHQFLDGYDQLLLFVRQIMLR